MLEYLWVKWCVFPGFSSLFHTRSVKKLPKEFRQLPEKCPGWSLLSINAETCRLFFGKKTWQCFWILSVTGSFKACARYFFFHQMIVFYENTFYFIQMFVFLSSPLFFNVGHCFRGWSKINVKVYGVINCVNKNLITHFVWYLEKVKIMTLKLCQLIEY